MAFELDHIFFFVPDAMEEAARFVAFGLTEGPPNVHPGQGTSCRRFFLANAYLELLWVSDPAQAQSQSTRRTRLWDRWVGRPKGACPFGLAFRPGSHQQSTPPFSGWPYRTQYLPDGWTLHVGSNADTLTEPMLIYLPFGRRPATQPILSSLQHRADLHEITRVELASPHTDELSPAMKALADAHLLKIRAAPEYLIEVGFDFERRAQTQDFRPLLPLVFHL